MIETIKPNERGAFAGEIAHPIHIATEEQGSGIERPYIFLDRPFGEAALSTIGQTNTLLKAMRKLTEHPAVIIEQRLLLLYQRLVLDHLQALSFCRS